MKQVLFLSLFLVTACMPAKKEYTVIREQSRPATEITAPVCPTSKPVCPFSTSSAPAQTPVYYAGTYTMQQPTMQFMVPAETMMQPAMMQAPVMTAPAVSYTYGTAPVMQQQTPQQPAMMMQNTQMTQTVQTTQNGGMETTVTEDASVIIMQHPSNRDLVKCAGGDDQCVLSYQSQGYVQLKNAPHFAGYNDVPSDSDYPTRRWRDNNDIPRW